MMNAKEESTLTEGGAVSPLLVCDLSAWNKRQDMLEATRDS
jgi:hypothetical protein